MADLLDVEVGDEVSPRLANHALLEPRVPYSKIAIQRDMMGRSPFCLG